MTGTPNDTADRGAIFRALHEAPGAFVIPNPWDEGTARICAALGFPALATTSAGLAFTRGLPEGEIPWDETLAHCAALVAATPLPVSADLEKGLGDSPESATRTIAAAAAIGLAGCSLEDHTGRPEDPIYDLSLAVERIAAAAEARDALPGDFVLTARAENFLWDRPDLDDTITRLRAFEAAGADVLYAPGLPDLDAIRAVTAALSRPLNVVMGLGGPLFTLDTLAEVGVKRVSLGGSLARHALGAVLRALRDIRDRGVFSQTENAVSYADLVDLFARGRPSP